MKATKHSCYACNDYNIDLLKVKTKPGKNVSILSQSFSVLFVLIHTYHY